jgi:hypothetical protein
MAIITYQDPPAFVWVALWMVLAIAVSLPIATRMPTWPLRLVVVWSAITVMTGLIELCFLSNTSALRATQDRGALYLKRRVPFSTTLRPSFWACAYSTYCTANPAYCRGDAIIIHEWQHMMWAAVPALLLLVLLGQAARSNVSPRGAVIGLLLVIIGLTQFQGTVSYWSWYHYKYACNNTVDPRWLALDAPYLVFGLGMLVLGMHNVLRLGGNVWPSTT